MTIRGREFRIRSGEDPKALQRIAQPLVSGIYSAPTGGVERIAGRHIPPAQAHQAGPAAPLEKAAYDSITVASISNTATRTLSFQLAIRNLDEIDSYLDDLV